MFWGYQESRDCVGRWAGIRPLLARYTRPFTVLDVGANAGYFAHQIARAFPEAVVVLLEAEPMCRREPGTIYLQHRATVETLGYRYDFLSYNNPFFARPEVARPEKVGETEAWRW